MYVMGWICTGFLALSAFVSNTHPDLSTRNSYSIAGAVWAVGAIICFK